MGQFATKRGPEGHKNLKEDKILPEETHTAKKELHIWMSRCDDCELRTIYEYFTNDFIYIVQSLETKVLLQELDSFNTCDVKKYEEMRNDLGPFVFAEKMVEDILAQGREAIIAFWKCLYELVYDYACSNLSSLLNYIKSLGDTLMHQIQLDKHGHPLSSELKDTQKLHKKYLLEYSQNVADKKLSTATCEADHHDHHMDMMVVSKLHRRSQHGVVESGVKHYSYLRKHITFINLECISLKMLFRGSYLFDGVPHSVLITGAPGVGKTTLLKTFVCEWVNGKIYQRFSFVFFFRFQELNRMGKVSLETMILQLYPYLEDRLPSILKYPEKILFIFDGLEESIHQIDFISPKFCTNVSQVENMGTIVVSLVGQSLMKGCFVLMTMETSRVKRRHTTAFTQVAEMMGFSPKNKKLFFHRYFKKKAFSDQVFSYVKDIGALYNFCFIPNFCWMVCEVFSMRFTQETINPQDFSLLPKTLTQLLAGFVSKILSNRKQDKSHNRKLLASIGWMAGYGISNDIFAFDEQVLAKFGIDATSELLHHFMLETNPPPNVTFRFLHPFMPEFLAALVHYINYSPEKLYNSLEKANTYKYCCDEVFLSFLCGLSNKSTRSVLRPYLGKLSSKSITRVVKYVSAWLIQQSNSEVHKLEEFRNNQRRCLTMFYYLYEARDKHLVREALGSCRRLNLSSVSLTPLDCTALAFILESCKYVEELDLGSCKFHEEYLRKFAPLLHNLKDLRLSSVMMTNDGVQFICPALINPESKIQTLWLGFNKLTDLSCIYLASAIRNNTSLRILDLSWNYMSGPHFTDLMDVLSSPTCRIEELWLDHAGLIETSAIQLASGIRNNRSLRKLNLSRNFLNGPHFHGLMKALSSPTCRIEELELCEIDLTDEYAPFLKTLSKNISLTHLDLSNNKMSDASGRHLKELILKSRLKEISIYLNRMMSREMRQNLRNLGVERPGLAVYMDG